MVRETTSLLGLRDDIVRQFAPPSDVRRMRAMSNAMRIQYHEKLQDSQACMLPSFCHTLPSGDERGTYMALDVGGSTFRVALVDLCSRGHADGPMRIKCISTAKIDASVRALPANKFFEWMAGKINLILAEEHDLPWSRSDVIPVGLAWSFPVEQTSHRGGKIQGMGKGFNCHQDTLGKDLGEQVEIACAKQGLNVQVDAIVNDSSATLLTQVYQDPATTMALILGTGTNAAVYLPIAIMGKGKFGDRDASWFDAADKVITNTELSMFGTGILPQTRFDEALNINHQNPGFQPLEYMTTGRYLGEIFRLIIQEAASNCGLFGSVMPNSLLDSYSLDTAILAQLEEDQTSTLSSSIRLVQNAFDLPVAPSTEEIAFLRTAAEAISRRAAAYLAIAVHALWALQRENSTTPTSRTSIACNGSVILKYPGFKDHCEDYINTIIRADNYAHGVPTTASVVLEPTNEAAVLGAAVAVALSDAT